jgi:hypothetical protein
MEIVRFNIKDWIPRKTCVMVFNYSGSIYIGKNDNQKYYTLCGQQLTIDDKFVSGKAYVIINPNTHNPY